MPELKPGFIANMRALLGEEAGAFFRALEEAPSLALRPHRGMEAAEPFIEGAVPWAAGGFYLRPGARPGASVAHWAGAFYLQEASAMLPAAALEARPGERVLDLCAAPGGKSSQIALAMGGEGVLVANEVDAARARVLAANLERLGVTNAVVLNETPARLAARWPGYFDAVLVDAPCSGEGMFRREPQSREAWTDAAPRGCAKRQAEILEAAAKLVRPGGRLLYSTCTFNGEENEGSVADFPARSRGLCPGGVRPAGAGRVPGRHAAHLAAPRARRRPVCRPAAPRGECRKWAGGQAGADGAGGIPGVYGADGGAGRPFARMSGTGAGRRWGGSGEPPSAHPAAAIEHLARRAGKSAPRPPRGQDRARPGRGRARCGSWANAPFPRCPSRRRAPACAWRAAASLPCRWTRRNWTACASSPPASPSCAPRRAAWSRSTPWPWRFCRAWRGARRR